jgi:hypothetical protein
VTHKLIVRIATHPWSLAWLLPSVWLLSMGALVFRNRRHAVRPVPADQIMATRADSCSNLPPMVNRRWCLWRALQTFAMLAVGLLPYSNPLRADDPQKPA